MVDQDRIIAIAREVATANLSSANFSSVLSEPSIDSEGQDALRITIVLTPGSSAAITGDTALNTLVQIHDQLQKAGEDRFPIIEYATADELASK